METPKTRRLSPAEHKARINNGVCPRCGDHRIVRSIRVSQSDDLRRTPRYLGAFYHCASGHTCWYMSGESSKDLRESTEGTDPIVLRTSPSSPAPVIHRKKG